MVTETLLSPSTPSRYIGSPITRGNTPARCGRVQQDQFILGNLLGSGGFGSVYVASLRGRTVAVKMYHKRCGNPRALQQAYNAELRVYRMGLKHRNLVSVLGATSLHGFEDGAWVLMDYVGPKTLQTLLNDHHGTHLDCQTRLSYSLQIARGLHYLHSLNIVHLDLKPANCLLTHDLTLLRIGDFGCSHQIIPAIDDPVRKRLHLEENKEVEKKEKGEVTEEVGAVVKEGASQGGGGERSGGGCVTPGAGRRRSEELEIEELGDGIQVPESWGGNEVAGTLAYRAPELLRGLKPTDRSDVYSLGITLWQMRTRKGPYEGVPPHAVVYQVVSKDLRPRQPSVDDDDPFETIFSDLYTQCWAKAGEDRPSSLEVVHAVGLWMDHM